MMDVSLGIAFLAGLISFLSPCVLPLVPAYISYLGGRMGQAVDAQVRVGAGGSAALQGRALASRFGLLLHGVAFVLGFTLVFVLLGVVTTALVQQLGGQNIRNVTDIISRLGGVLIIFFGLHFGGFLSLGFNRLRAAQASAPFALIVGLLTALGVVLLTWGFAGRLAIWARPDNLPAFYELPVWPNVLAILAVMIFLLGMFLGGAFNNPRGFLLNLIQRLDLMLYADTRQQLDSDSGNGLAGSMMMGVIFSAGWSPCIGAVYGAILTMSANTGNVADAAVLLTAYSFGLGVPFLLAAFALDRVQGLFRRINRQMRVIKLVSGLLLVMVGLLVASGELTRLNAQLQMGAYADWSVKLEDCTLSAAQGTLDGSIQDCMDAQ